MFVRRASLSNNYSRAYRTLNSVEGTILHEITLIFLALSKGDSYLVHSMYPALIAFHINIGVRIRAPNLDAISISEHCVLLDTCVLFQAG